MGNMLARQRDGFAGLGIAAGARRAVVQRKTAKAPDLDALAVGQGASHHLQQRLHRKIDVVGLQVPLALGEDFDEFGLGHGALAGVGQPMAAWFDPGRRRILRYYSDLPPSCSRSSAPSLVVPLEASAEARLYSARVSATSASSFALIDSCRVRPLRSMPVNLASIESPTFRCWLASSTRSSEMSRAIT